MNNEKQFGRGILLNIFNARNIVFVAMLAVGALCIFMSARNTAGYLLLTGMDFHISVMTGMALIVFSATSFTAAQLFLSQKGAAKLFSIFFVVVGITVITFSIFSTLSLNYSKFISSEAIQKEIQELIEKRRSQIMAEYHSFESQSEGQNVNEWLMGNIDRLLTMAESTGESWSRSMQVIMETAQGINSTEQVKQQSLDEMLASIYIETIPRTFFGFMLNLDTLDKKYFFDFFMIATPAIFYDLLAPLAITVVLFLMGFKVKRETEVVVEGIVAAPLEHKPIEEPPDIKDLITYIENAMQEGYQILPDEAVPNMDVQKCIKLRKYLTSYVYKGSPLISWTDGQYISIFGKVDLIRFITLQGYVQRQAVAL
jgi:hypothetical protein